MAAGAVGMDHGLLVVAADDGIMPQTREHLRILDLLGVAGLTVAITKADMVDDARTEQVRAEVANYVGQTRFGDVACHVVSSRQGLGVQALKQALFALAVEQPLERSKHFRLAIDRVFVVKGLGVAVTGAVIAGQVQVGDTLALAHAALEVRVRSIHAQNQSADVATLGQLAGGIAHELAQPLQAMIAAAQACSLRLSRPDDAGAVDHARSRLVWIAGQAARAGRTIQHLLAFSRGTSTSGVTRLSDAVAGSLELVGRNLSQAMVTVTVDVPQELPLVLGGLVEVEQVLVNLLLNARDALGESSNRKVDIRGTSRDDKVVLTVADTGGGIPPQIISRVFDPFFTTKPAGKGTGLGLAISQKTMIALGGSIAVRNTETGAEFTLVFQALRELE
jgi:C4-dicarboxylate-specific signal transduction histidine kinase